MYLESSSKKGNDMMSAHKSASLGVIEAVASVLTSFVSKNDKQGWSKKNTSKMFADGSSSDFCKPRFF